jgi:hypothetical protein
LTARAYAALASIRDEFRALVEEWTAEHPYLLQAQERLRKARGYEDYRVETPIVYNRALDELESGSEIKIVLVADNPGKNEQLERNNRYLVGQSGKLAEGWMRRELGIGFRSEVAILNKTPVHTPKTAELAMLEREAGIRGDRLQALLAGSQAAMADLAWRLFEALRSDAAAGGAGPWPVLWISGLGELKDRGLFEPYRDALSRRLARASEAQAASVWAFNHFSMNQFAIELDRKARKGETRLEELERVGAENRKRVFGI